MTMRVAVIGDVGGHRDELRRELYRLGAIGRLGRLPDDLVVVQVGDLVHRGPDSDGVVELVDRYLWAQPAQWIQLIGNHEVYYLRDPVFDWSDHVGVGSRRTLRRWWRDGRAQVATAVRTADEDFLITHAGVTESFWREHLDATPDVVDAARRINAMAHDGADVLYRGGSMLGGGPPNPMVGPIWAERGTELLPGWSNTTMPFSQIHGHSGSHGPCDNPATSYDAERRHEETRLLGGRVIGVDPGHGARPESQWQSLLLTASEALTSG